MATPVGALQTVCRSCRRSLARATSAPTQTRPFSASTTRSKAIPQFAETTNDELNVLISKWRKEVFTPAALSKNHKRLVYKKSRQSLITNDPGVTVTLSNEEEVKLEPLDLLKRPNKRKSLITFAQILGETDDIAVWNNFISFLEGMHLSKEVLPVDMLEKITRKANEVGRHDVIRQAAQRVRWTGLQLSIRPVTRELFLGIHIRAAEDGFVGDALQGALKEADTLAYLLGREEHCGASLPRAKPDWTPEEHERHIDMRRDATIMGILLELQAAQALEAHNGQDSTGEVTKAASRLLALVDESEGEGILQRTGHGGRSETLLERWIPIAHGIRQALSVDGLAGGQRDAETKMKMKLKALLDQFDKAIAEERANVKETKSGRPQRALKMLDQVRK